MKQAYTSIFASLIFVLGLIGCSSQKLPVVAATTINLTTDTAQAAPSVFPTALIIDDVAGTYDLRALDIPGYGDVRARLVISKSGEIYSSNLKNDFNLIEILSTEVNGNDVFITAKTGSRTIDFDLIIVNGKVDGWLSNTYQVVGARVN